MNCNYDTPGQGYSRTETNTSAGWKDEILADESEWVTDCTCTATIVMRMPFKTSSTGKDKHQHIDDNSRRKS